MWPHTVHSQRINNNHLCSRMSFRVWGISAWSHHNGVFPHAISMQETTIVYNCLHHQSSHQTICTIYHYHCFNMSATKVLEFSCLIDGSGSFPETSNCRLCSALLLFVKREERVDAPHIIVKAYSMGGRPLRDLIRSATKKANSKAWAPFSRGSQ